MAHAAVQALNGSYVGEHCISCKLADRDKDRGAQNQPSNNLYIGNLPTSWGVGEVSELFGMYGPISSLVVLSDPVTGGSRGVSLVRYHTVEDGTQCIDALNGVVLDGHDRPLEVKYAETSTEKHLRKSGKKRNPAPKRAANPRNRGRTTGEPRSGNGRSRLEDSPSTANAGRSSSNSSASNGTAEVESPVTLGSSKPSGPSANLSGFAMEFATPTPPRPATAASRPAAAAPAAPALGSPLHPFLLRPAPAVAGPHRGAMAAPMGPSGVPLGPFGAPMSDMAAMGRAFLGVGAAGVPPLSALPVEGRSPLGLRFPRRTDLTVQQPQPQSQPTPATPVRGAVLKVTGLPRAYDEIALYKLFTPFGAVESVTIPNLPAGGPGAAFVRFRLAKDASIAVSHLRGAVMHDQPLQVEFF